MEEGWRGRYEAGERETRCKQRIRQRKGILNNMSLESLKILKKRYEEWRNGISVLDPAANLTTYLMIRFTLHMGEIHQSHFFPPNI